jgi:hypothetical protein
MCLTYTALASGMIWIFNPRDGKPSRGVRPLCRLKINTAEAEIDAAVAGVGVPNVLSNQIVKPVSEGSCPSSSKYLNPNRQHADHGHDRENLEEIVLLNVDEAEHCVQHLRLLSAVATSRDSLEAFGDPAAERLQVVREHANAFGQLLGRHRVLVHDPPEGCLVNWAPGVRVFYVDGVFAHEPVADPVFRRPEGAWLCSGRRQDAFELAPPRTQARP